MNPTVITYLVYIVVSVALTIWVARTLSRNGEVFLIDVFHGEENVAAATNRLLVVGFYLVNLGFVSLMLRVSQPVTSAQQAIEALASKLGAVALLLGVFHLGNVLVLSRVRRHRPVPAQPRAPTTRPDRATGRRGLPPTETRSCRAPEQDPAPTEVARSSYGRSTAGGGGETSCDVPSGHPTTPAPAADPEPHDHPARRVRPGPAAAPGSPRTTARRSSRPRPCSRRARRRRASKR